MEDIIMTEKGSGRIISVYPSDIVIESNSEMFGTLISCYKGRFYVNESPNQILHQKDIKEKKASQFTSLERSIMACNDALNGLMTVNDRSQLKKEIDVLKSIHTHNRFSR